MVSFERQGSDMDDASSSYGQPSVAIKTKPRFSRSRLPKEKPEKMIHVNTAMQHKYMNLRRTARSRFEGVKKYF